MTSEPVRVDTGTPDKERFLLELEFVQSLANPHYLNWLAQNRYLDDLNFLAFLKYLSYWKEAPYATYIIYPQCLEFLDLLQNAEFRTAIANPHYEELVHSQQFYFWKDYKNNRTKEVNQTTQ